jgi:nucleoside-diphosphate-sugar epimerase
VARLANSLLQMTGLYNQEIHVLGELGESIAVSIEKARRELGYEPEIDLEEGMRRSIAWCRSMGVAI